MRYAKSMLAAGGALAVLLLSSGAVAAEPVQAQPGETELAKKTQNPVSDLVSIPFQTNFYGGGDLRDRTSIVLNVQPVAPTRLTSRWSVISRTIVPVISTPSPGGGRSTGIGDIQEQLVLSPAKPGGFIWGVGPLFSVPTATAEGLETGSWAAGPNGVVVLITGPWVVGAIANQLWTFSDTGGSPETNAFLLQYFVNYNLARGWALSTSPVITANWDAPGGDEWTVPFGGGLSKTTMLGHRPLSIGVQYYYAVERPTGAGANQLRVQISLLYPMAKKP